MATRILVVVASVALIALIIGGVVVLGRGTTSGDKPAASAAPAAKLEVTDLVVGTGAEATLGKHLKVNYVGTLTNGTQFGSSDQDGPLELDLGQGQVIPGWDQGLVGMKVGGKRKLTIPPSLGYGSQAKGSIPPNSTLIFQVELLDVK